jgi:hypothetical protein
VSRHERYGTRSLVYSKWHRFYLGDQEPMIDLDGVEYCGRKAGRETCWKALALIETARDTGQAGKPTHVLADMAQRMGALGLCVLYRVDNGTDPLTGCLCEERREVDGCTHGIDRFRVRKIWPDPVRLWTVMTPEEFRDRLRAVRMHHIAAEHSAWEVA